jgi:hypothetical protein
MVSGCLTNHQTHTHTQKKKTGEATDTDLSGIEDGHSTADVICRGALCKAGIHDAGVIEVAAFIGLICVNCTWTSDEHRIRGRRRRKSCKPPAAAAEPWL